jgi:hypothetical protein
MKVSLRSLLQVLSLISLPILAAAIKFYDRCNAGARFDSECIGAAVTHPAWKNVAVGL